MNNIRQIRIRNNLTQKALADILGVDRTAVAKWERGDNGPSSSVLIRMSDYFGVSIDYLLGKSDAPTNPVAALAPDDGLDERLAVFKSLPPDAQQEVLRYMRYLAAQQENNENGG